MECCWSFGFRIQEANSRAELCRHLDARRRIRRRCCAKVSTEENEGELSSLLAINALLASTKTNAHRTQLCWVLVRMSSNSKCICLTLSLYKWTWSDGFWLGLQMRSDMDLQTRFCQLSSKQSERILEAYTALLDTGREEFGFCSHCLIVSVCELPSALH